MTRPPVPRQSPLALWLIEAPRALLVAACIACALFSVGGALATATIDGWVATMLVPVVALSWRFGARWGAVLGVVAVALICASLPTAPMIDGASRSTGLVMDFVAVGLVAVLVGHLRAAWLAEQHAARHDPLTGALNRRAFLARLDKIAARRPLDTDVQLLVYLDLDGFKTVNDRYGHDAGDRVLTTCADAIRAQMGSGETLARYGGDEFVAMIRARDFSDPYTQADDLHFALTEAFAALGYAGLGCSMGVLVIAPPAAATRAALLGWADALMYDVKRAGKGGLRVGHAAAMAS